LPLDHQVASNLKDLMEVEMDGRYVEHKIGLGEGMKNPKNPKRGRLLGVSAAGAVGAERVDW
jgi:hypothetical protein